MSGIERKPYKYSKSFMKQCTKCMCLEQVVKMIDEMVYGTHVA